MNLTIRRSAVVAALALSAGWAAGPAQGEVVVSGSDYFSTIQPTFFTPLGGLNPLAGLPIGPGDTDTIVRRLGDCSLSLLISGSNCTIPIEMVALSLVSVVNPNVRLRESPTLASAGTMMMFSDGMGNGGSFDSFFDVFFELSLDAGMTWAPQGSLALSSAGTAWEAQAPAAPEVVVEGLVGDGNANRHTNKALNERDFRLIGVVSEQHPLGRHSARPARVAEPGSLALVGLALLAAGCCCAGPQQLESIRGRRRALELALPNPRPRRPIRAGLSCSTRGLLSS